MAWDVSGDASTVLRLNAGAYHSRIPILVFAQSVTTNGAFQQIFFRSSFGLPGQGPPAIGDLIDGSTTPPFLPDIHVTAKDLELPRTWSFAGEIEREVTEGIAASLSYQHARTDHLFRFVDRNDSAFGSRFRLGTHPGGGGIGTLTSAESSARSRYHAVTAGLRGQDALDGLLTFDLSYTLSLDRSDDDNERDPFTFRYADPSNLEPSTAGRTGTAGTRPRATWRSRCPAMSRSAISCGISRRHPSRRAARRAGNGQRSRPTGSARTARSSNATLSGATTSSSPGT